MIKVSYQNNIWDLHQNENVLNLIDANNKSNILEIERKEFEDLLHKDVITFWDNYVSQNQTSSLTYFESKEDISEKEKTKLK